MSFWLETSFRTCRIGVGRCTAFAPATRVGFCAIAASQVPRKGFKPESARAVRSMSQDQDNWAPEPAKIAFLKCFNAEDQQENLSKAARMNPCRCRKYRSEQSNHPTLPLPNSCSMCSVGMVTCVEGTDRWLSRTQTLMTKPDVQLSRSTCFGTSSKQGVVLPNAKHGPINVAREHHEMLKLWCKVRKHAPRPSTLLPESLHSCCSVERSKT